MTNKTYSVPSRLCGHEVKVHQYADYLEVYYKDHMVERLERVRGEHKSRIDYRHIIWSLVRKPGAFARYRFREHLFPTPVFRQAYDALGRWHGGRTDVESGREPLMLEGVPGLTPARVAVARIALPLASIHVGDCDEGWPFPGFEDTFSLCDADAYAYPYGAIRAFWKYAHKADAVGILGTDAQMQQHGLNAHFRHPDGHSVHNVLPKDRSRTRATYWTRLVKPWLAALVAPDGYSIIMTKHFERSGMHYWGAVAKR